MIIRPNGTISRLPSGYTEVEYIKSSGTQYIDTGFVPNGNSKVEFEYSDRGTTNGVWFGSYPNSSSWTDRSFGLFQNYTASNQFFVHYQSNVGISLSSIKTIATVIFDKGNLYIDGTSVYTTSTLSFNCVQTMYFLSGHGSSTQNQPMTAKVYYLKIWDNGTLIRDFIPCYRNSDNEVGLYDTVTNTFFTNAGTGVFTTGDIIKDYEVLKPRKGSTNINNVYLGETRVYGETLNPQNVKLLMHFDDSLTDETGLNTASMTSGSATYVTGKFGKAINTSSRAVRIPYSSNFGFETNDWTIACWIYIPSLGTVETDIISNAHRYNSSNQWSGFKIYLDGGKKIAARIPSTYQSAGASYLTDASNITTNAWHHIAVTKSGTIAYLFVDGVLKASTNLPSQTTYTGGSYIRIGCDHDGSTSATGDRLFFQGYIDEVIISNGTAFWTSNFTPPSEPYQL